MIAGKTVLITGGTGTFGQAFTKYCLDHEAKEVRIFSRDELKQSEITAKISDKRVKFIVGDIRDLGSITKACYGVDLVVHAAAMKRLETCEKEPEEAIKTNVLGSLNVIKACNTGQWNVAQAIALSSDKAVYPVNTYGKTKALMESLWIQANGGVTKFSIVRYGNVMGSRGSVACIFRKQAEEGTVKITNPQMTRFFMPVSVATDLVHKATSMMFGGEIFVPTLKAISIGKLAKIVAKNTPIEVIGERPGEKAHESLLTDKEMIRTTVLNNVAIVDPEFCDWHYVARRGDLFPVSNFSVFSKTAPELSEAEVMELLA